MTWSRVANCSSRLFRPHPRARTLLKNVYLLSKELKFNNHLNLAKTVDDVCNTAVKGDSLQLASQTNSIKNSA